MVIYPTCLYAIFMHRYHHMGIPTTEKREDEEYVEIDDYKFYSTPFEANKWHIQWHRFPEGHGLPEIVTKVPHVGIQIDDMAEELKGQKILFGPYEPLPGYKVAMIEVDGVPIELIETKLSDSELSALEQDVLGKKSGDR